MTIQDQISNLHTQLTRASDARTKELIRRKIRQLGFRLIDEKKGSN